MEQDEEVSQQCYTCLQPCSPDAVATCPGCACIVYCSHKHRRVHSRREHGGAECARLAGFMQQECDRLAECDRLVESARLEPAEAEFARLAGFIQQESQFQGQRDQILMPPHRVDKHVVDCQQEAQDQLLLRGEQHRELRSREYSQQEYSPQEYSQQDYSQQDYSQQDYSQQEYSQREYSQQDYSQQEYSQRDAQQQLLLPIDHHQLMPPKGDSLARVLQLASSPHCCVRLEAFPQAALALTVLHGLQLLLPRALGQPESVGGMFDLSAPGAVDQPQGPTDPTDLSCEVLQVHLLGVESEVQELVPSFRAAIQAAAAPPSAAAGSATAPAVAATAAEPPPPAPAGATAPAAAAGSVEVPAAAGAPPPPPAAGGASSSSVQVAPPSLPANLQLRLSLIGPGVPPALDQTQEDIPGVGSVHFFHGLYHDVLRRANDNETAGCKAGRVGSASNEVAKRPASQTRTASSLAIAAPEAVPAAGALAAPDAVLLLNAGLPAFPDWVPTLRELAKRRCPVLVSDFNLEAAHRAREALSCLLCATEKQVSSTSSPTRDALACLLLETDTTEKSLSSASSLAGGACSLVCLLSESEGGGAVRNPLPPSRSGTSLSSRIQAPDTCGPSSKAERHIGKASHVVSDVRINPLRSLKRMHVPGLLLPSFSNGAYFTVQFC